MENQTPINQRIKNEFKLMVKYSPTRNADEGNK